MLFIRVTNLPIILKAGLPVGLEPAEFCPEAGTASWAGGFSAMMEAESKQLDIFDHLKL